MRKGKLAEMENPSFSCRPDFPVDGMEPTGGKPCGVEGTTSLGLLPKTS